MVIVTDKEFYIDDTLKWMCDLTIKRTKTKWDNLIIIDGMERGGKTTMAKTIAYYIAHTKKIPFSVDNAFFDQNELMNFATNNTEQIIIWDEAAIGGQSNQWYQTLQQKLNTMLMLTGKYRHTYIFIIPSFFRLNRYLAIDRSIALIHIYTPDLITRGLFSAYNTTQKNYIYNSYKKTESYGKNPSFRGRFTIKNTETIWDEEIYEKKKDEAIRKFINQELDPRKNIKAFKKVLVDNFDKEMVMKVYGITEKTYYNWRNAIQV